MYAAKRQFQLLTPNNQVVGTFYGSTPHQAAKKAASRGVQNIMLQEHVGRGYYKPTVHVYSGTVRQLDASETTPFAWQHGIRSRPQVTKIGTMRPPATRTIRMGKRTRGDDDEGNVRFESGYEDLIRDQGDGKGSRMYQREQECNSKTDQASCNAAGCTMHDNGTCYLEE